MRIKLITGSVLLATVLLTGCSPEVPRAQGTAGPVASPSATAASGPSPVTAVPSATRSSAPSKPADRPVTRPPTPRATTKPAAAGRVLGPDGLGSLRLGLTEQQADRTGLITEWSGKAGKGCRYGTVRGSSGAGTVVTGHSDHRIRVINAWAGVRTPEGVRIGTAWSAARRAYPGLRTAAVDGLGAEVGIARTFVPGNGDALYRFSWGGGKVQEIALEWNQDCYE